MNYWITTHWPPRVDDDGSHRHRKRRWRTAKDGGWKFHRMDEICVLAILGFRIGHSINHFSRNNIKPES